MEECVLHLILQIAEGLLTRVFLIHNSPFYFNFKNEHLGYVVIKPRTSLWYVEGVIPCSLKRCTGLLTREQGRPILPGSRQWWGIPTGLQDRVSPAQEPSCHPQPKRSRADRGGQHQAQWGEPESIAAPGVWAGPWGWEASEVGPRKSICCQGQAAALALSWLWASAAKLWGGKMLSGPWHHEALLQPNWEGFYLFISPICEN